VRNPWRYHFRHRADEPALQSVSGLQSALHVQRVSQRARDYHVSSCRFSSTDHVHSVYDGEQAAADVDNEVSDWFITGGSSGGSAVAVATGVAFA